ncbi:hypothetical protein CLV28_3014 [Sediminihabitans luteus]|uniref:DUF4190 domain-containing protein n=1 Tax=Sediminihabitans luteus TaxID=1138585 RepID=A0A2M9CC61_9CELL|nr:DUF4190 domain-containing protein [Sediminihabitans luteus]PJJ68598.1 hypothetical protein CLV28_3014 [Sediminihabitans luteus]GII99936.1 hypothetical protein Slu03_23140 [Sediminihabitans luteus]
MTTDPVTPDGGARTPQSGAALVAQYLDDLERALADADPAERAETVTAVRDHLEDALGTRPPLDDARDVIAGLGPVELIAGAATPFAAAHGSDPRARTTAHGGPTAAAPSGTVVDPTPWTGPDPRFGPPPSTEIPPRLPGVALGLATLSLVTSLAWIVSWPLAIAAIVCAVVHLTRSEKRRGMAWTAIGLGVLSFAVSLVIGLFSGSTVVEETGQGLAVPVVTGDGPAVAGLVVAGSLLPGE